MGWFGPDFCEFSLLLPSGLVSLREHVPPRSIWGLWAEQHSSLCPSGRCGPSKCNPMVVVVHPNAPQWQVWSIQMHPSGRHGPSKCTPMAGMVHPNIPQWQAWPIQMHPNGRHGPSSHTPMAGVVYPAIPRWRGEVVLDALSTDSGEENFTNKWSSELCKHEVIY